MADLFIPPTPAARLLTILNEGRITKDEYDSIAAGLTAHDSTITITGNVTIASPTSPTFNGLDVVSRVLNTAELLEQILLHLPPLFIISTTSRVSKGFGRAIETSPALQRRIFRTPDRTFNGHPSLLKLGNTGVASWLKAATSFTTTVNREPRKSLHLAVDLRPLSRSLTLSPTLRRTLLSLPPVQRVNVVTSGPSRSSYCQEVGGASPDGMTFGDLHAAIRSIRNKMGDRSGFMYDILMILS